MISIRLIYIDHSLGGKRIKADVMKFYQQKQAYIIARRCSSGVYRTSHGTISNDEEDPIEIQ